MNYNNLQKTILQFRDDRDWKQFHNPKDLATAIAIEASELQEHFLRKSQEKSYEIWQDYEVHEEFADLFNYMILFAHECNIDIEKVVLEKIKKNNEKYPVLKAKGNSDKYNKL